MVHYRRNRVAGGTYLFTVTLRDRSSDIRQVKMSEAYKNDETVKEVADLYPLILITVDFSAYQFNGLIVSNMASCGLLLEIVEGRLCWSTAVNDDP